MLIRRSSGIKGAMALALAGLSGFVSSASAQPPAPGATKVVPPKGGSAPAALVPSPVIQESVLSPIGNKASGNADVTFVNGRFVMNGQPVAAGQFGAA